MKRLLTSALAAALVVVGAARDGAVEAAQDTQDDVTGRRASLIDLGTFAGGALNSSWFTTAADEDWPPGFAPVFGAQWLSPTSGIRLHGKYLPSNDDFFGGDSNDDWVQNNWFYDLDLVWRSLFWSDGGLLGSLYASAGDDGAYSDMTVDREGSIAIKEAAWRRKDKAKGEWLAVSAFSGNGSRGAWGSFLQSGDAQVC